MQQYISAQQLEIIESYTSQKGGEIIKKQEYNNCARDLITEE